MSRETTDSERDPAPTAGLTTPEVANRLNRADIILTRGGGPVSHLIRRFTQSYWNHAAIVFVLSDDASNTQQGFQSTFILEAEPQGIDIHPIDKYLHNERQDMVLLRFPDSPLSPPGAESTSCAESGASPSRRSMPSTHTQRS